MISVIVDLWGLGFTPPRTKLKRLGLPRRMEDNPHVNPGIKYNATARLICKDSFSGGGQIECKSNGEWTKPSACTSNNKCSMCERCGQTTGGHKSAKLVTGGNKVSIGSTLKVRCKLGYVNLGEASSRASPLLDYG